MPKSIIYLVDDDDDDIFLAQLTFTDHFPDWELTSFNDGQALIDHLELNTAGPLPALILLDLNMPRLTGFETLTLLKGHDDWKQIPVAILTTSNNEEDQVESKRLGACAFLTKPATIEHLADVIINGKANGLPQ